MLNERIVSVATLVDPDYSTLKIARNNITNSIKIWFRCQGNYTTATKFAELPDDILKILTTYYFASADTKNIQVPLCDSNGAVQGSYFKMILRATGSYSAGDIVIKTGGASYHSFAFFEVF